MLERRSALASVKPHVSGSLRITERRGFTLTQVAGLDGEFESRLSQHLGELPASVGVAQETGVHTIFRIGPAQLWIVGPESDGTAARLEGQWAVTPLSHSRTRIAIEGAPARGVLAKLVPVDLHPAVFTPGRVALTGIHHTPVTLHCTGPDAFDVYVMRTFAADLWEVITDAALEHC